MLRRSVIETIGNTPLVSLERLKQCGRGVSGRVLCKLENVNPGGSKKDRVALEIVLEAKRTGELAEGQPVVELTSGNTGTGLSIVCKALGHPCYTVMSKGNSVERVRMMKAFGAIVELVPQSEGSIENQVSGKDLELVEARTQELVAELGAFRADQFHRQANMTAHYKHTALEIIEQSGGNFDAFVDFVGTGGTFAGCSKRFKEFNHRINCFALEPQCAPTLQERFHNTQGSIRNSGRHKIQGGGYAMSDLVFIEAAVAAGHVDGFLTVTDEEAMATCQLLAREEGILGGFSAGANVHAALQLIDSGQAETVVAIVCDSGMKYISTDLYM